MHYVYILRSVKNPKRLYVGCARNIEQRMRQHNSGDGAYSKAFAPWELETYTAFKDQPAAEAFERYLKSGSGHAFLKRHLLAEISLAAAKSHRES